MNDRTRTTPWFFTSNALLASDRRRSAVLVYSQRAGWETCGKDGLLKPLNDDIELINLITAAPLLRAALEQVTAMTVSGWEDAEVYDKVIALAKAALKAADSTVEIGYPELEVAK